MSESQAYYCEHCGYDLHDRADGGARCPECGETTDFAGLVTDRGTLERRAEQLAACGQQAAIALFASVLAVLIELYARLPLPGGLEGGWLLWALSAVMTARFVLKLRSFRRQAHAKPGWLGLLARFVWMSPATWITIIILVVSYQFGLRGLLIGLPVGVLVGGYMDHRARRRIAAYARAHAVAYVQGRHVRKAAPGEAPPSAGPE